MKLGLLSTCLSVLCLGTTSGLASTSELRLKPDKVTFVGPRDNLEVTISELHGDRIQVSVRIGERTVSVPQRFLFGAEHLSLDTIRLGVSTPKSQPLLTDTKGKELWREAAETNFFILFEFGRGYDHGTSEEPVEVFKGLMIVFELGELKGAELAIPAGEFQNEWRFKTRYLNEFEGEDESTGEYGPEKGILLPWSGSDGK